MTLIGIAWILCDRRRPGIGRMDNHRRAGLSRRPDSTVSGPETEGRRAHGRSYGTIGPVRRSGTALVILLFPALLQVHAGVLVHHRFHGPPFDYLGLAVASAASWVGLPGPGEPVLIAAGVLASKHRLDLTEVLLVAWVSATMGGIAGWAIGRKAGRPVLTARGPLLAARLKAVERGEAIFVRYPVAAIMLTPSWVAGINRVPSRIYQPTNAIAAALWAGGIGVSSYLVGPAVVDWVGDLGTGTAAIVAAVIVGALAMELTRRYRRRHRPRPEG
jgi:membrane protein DedA with SNARE-associated domain